MIFQYFLVLICLGASFAYLSRRTWLTWSGNGGGCGSCGSGRCSSKVTSKNKITEAPLISINELTQRLRLRNGSMG